MNFRTMMDHAMAATAMIAVADLRDELARDIPPLVIDCRQRDEFANGMIEGAVPVPRGQLEIDVPKLVAASTPIVLYCAGGTRSALGAQQLASVGYTNVRSLAGGFGRWKQEAAPFVIPQLPGPHGDVEEGAELPPSKLIGATELAALGDQVFLLDVREDGETDAGHIKRAHVQSRGFLDSRIEGVVGAKDTPIVVISSVGVRAAYAARTLGSLGYTDVRTLEGGMGAWREAGLPVHVPRTLSARDRLRYARHLIIPEIGDEGQMTLLDSKVLLMGAGGLGSPAAYYLAAAGIGKLGIIDSDLVDRSNLQRQILHTDDRVGTPKVESARMTLERLNPDIEIVTYNAWLTRDNVESIFEGWDLVIDGGDNFPTRYLVNDACVRLNVPCVHGSVYRFEGQVTVFSPGAGPCYRCLYPEPPPPALAPSCAQAGVLGVIPGIIGLLQASEAIKVLLGLGTPLIGRLVHFDALKFEFREMRLRRDPSCRVCADDADWQGYPDYQHFCGVS